VGEEEVLIAIAQGGTRTDQRTGCASASCSSSQSGSGRLRPSPRVRSRDLRNHRAVWFDCKQELMKESGLNTETGTAPIVDKDQIDELSEVLPQVIAAFRGLDPAARRKLFQTIATLFDLDQVGRSSASRGGVDVPNASRVHERFSREHPVSAKEFLLRKQPRTDVERVACLAYYLTHYRDTPHFKTLDISTLNTEAAQVKFANAAKTVNNATSYGYLAAATKGNKQLSAVGERFVEALPDRDAARAAMELGRPRRKSKPLGRSYANSDE